MDSTADVLFEQLRSLRAVSVEAELFRPSFRRWFTRAGNSRHLRNLDRGLNRYFHYPAMLPWLAGRFDIFHVIDHSYAHLVRALPAARTVVTCHDVDIFRDAFRKPLGGRNAVLQAISRRVVRGLRQAAAISCDSVQTRNQLVALEIADASRLHVIPIGIHPAFGPNSDPIADRAVTRRLGPPAAECFEILHVGSTIARKRIPFLLRVLAEISRLGTNIRLLRVGGALTTEQSRLATELGVADRIVTLPFLGRRELAAVYRRARLTVLPSAAEGFGLPVTESLSCGTPVVLSDLPVLHETGGDAAVYCALDDAAAWVRAVIGLIGEDRCIAAARRMRGFAWASRFSAQAYAVRTAELYARVAGAHRAADAKPLGSNRGASQSM